MKSSVKMCGWIVLMSCALDLSVVQAATHHEVNLVCPIDGEKFKTTLAGSGTSFGQFLDLMPFGAITAPWPLAKCPATGFILYKEQFSDDEVARLRVYVASTDYKNLRDVHTNYYLASKLRASLGEKLPKLAFNLLQATWEAKGSQYEQYAAEALEAYGQEIVSLPAASKEWLNHQLVAGELERRLGRFDEARARFLALIDQEQAKSGIFKEIVQLQLQLIDAKDKRKTLIPRTQDVKK